MIQYGHYVDGKHFAGSSGRKAEVFQPMDGTVRATVALASAADVRAAVTNAKAAQPAWAATNPQRRARVLMKFNDLIAQHNEELADILAREHGKTLIDAKGELGFIDCGHSGLGDRYIDLVGTAEDIEEYFGAEWMKPFLASYGAVTWDAAKARFFSDLYELY